MPIPLLVLFCYSFGAVGAVASIIFAANAHSSYNRANDEVNKWDADPVMKVGHARNEAHKHGFPYIYANTLKLGEGPSRRALFHPIQVEYEYKKYFESFCSKLLNQFNLSVDSWMNQFRSCNPISSGYMLYGLGRIPDRMKLVIEDYTRLASLLEDIARSYDQLKIDVRKTARERIDSYTKTKNDQLQPLAQTRDKGIADAEADKDKVLRDPEASDSRRREARDTFTAIKEALKDNYTRNTAPINKKYDVKIKEVEKERDERLTKLDGQKASQLGNNYRAARELLERAKEAWDNKGYQPVNFQQYFPYHNHAACLGSPAACLLPNTTCPTCLSTATTLHSDLRRMCIRNTLIQDMVSLASITLGRSLHSNSISTFSRQPLNTEARN